MTPRNLKGQRNILEPAGFLVCEYSTDGNEETGETRFSKGSYSLATSLFNAFFITTFKDIFACVILLIKTD